MQDSARYKTCLVHMLTMGRTPENIDYVMDSLEESERRDRGGSAGIENAKVPGKILIGKVDQFFSKINVAAVTLAASLKVGDIIEIGNEEEAIRQRVSSMQINKEDIQEAIQGDDVGIKLKYPVSVGSEVFKIVPQSI